MSTHGEAPCARWRRLHSTSGRVRPIPGRPRPTSGGALHYGLELPEARIELRRTLTLDPDRPVIYCEEHAESLSCYDRPISWNEHVTFGPPFLEPGATLFDMPATRSKVCSADYSARNSLEADAEFVWPGAPRKGGGCGNLRTTSDGQFGHYTAQLLDPTLDVAFVSACNPQQGLLVVYAFRREDFPWVGNWEERNNREVAPWHGRTFCRGMELSTTPFAIPRRDSIDQGLLFGERTYRWLPAKSSLTVRFLVLLCAVPGDFTGVQRFTIQGRQAAVTEWGPRERCLRVPVKPFLLEP